MHPEGTLYRDDLIGLHGPPWGSVAVQLGRRSKALSSSDGTPSIRENDVNETGLQHRRSILI
jgi:hypothetical protein